MGVGNVEQCSTVNGSVFARSATQVAVATMSKRFRDGDVGNGVAPDPDPWNGPKVVRVGHGSTILGPLRPRNFQVPSFHAGGFGWLVAQSFHHTATLT